MPSPLRCAVFLLALLPMSLRGDDNAALPLSLRPEVQKMEWAQSWWMPRHEQKLKEKADLERVDLLWIGDSITHGWEEAGREVWKEFFADHHPFNIGFSGDRTEQVLWRFENGEIDGIEPKVAVVMIGTNNTGHRQESTEDTAAGIEAIVQQLRTKLPKTHVVLLAIFPRSESPRDGARVRNDAINAQLAKKYADVPHVTYLDIGHAFLNDDGTLKHDLMPDWLHPNAAGYRVWAQAIQPTLARLLPSP